MKNILSQRDDLIADIGKKLKEAVTKVTNAFAYESEWAQISVCVGGWVCWWVCWWVGGWVGGWVGERPYS
jgi:hypothetical protein